MKELWKKYRYYIGFGFVKNKPLRLLFSVLRIYLGILLLLFLLQETLVFQAGSEDWDHCATPSLKVLEIEHSGELLRGWLREVKEPRNRLFVFHGNAHHACDRIYYLNLFDPKNNSEVVFVEYPGYDGSDFSYQKFLERGPALYDHLQKRNRLITYVVGESLGTAPATFLAKSREVKAMMLNAPFPSLAEVAQDKFPIFPVRWLIRFPFPASAWAKEVKASVLVVHGDQDRIVPTRFGEEQVKNFPFGELMLVKGAGHNDWMELLTATQRLRIMEFFETSSDIEASH